MFVMVVEDFGVDGSGYGLLRFFAAGPEVCSRFVASRLDALLVVVVDADRRGVWGVAGR